jgi:site-specific recombinase XerD
VFPVYAGEKTAAEKMKSLCNFQRRVNKALRAVAALVGFDVDGLSFYTARHSYADILKNAGVSVEVISQALGHSDIRVTDAYLKGFGDKVLDDADLLILN